MNEITIRIGGESGEGTISGGDLIALGAARWGYHVYTFRTFPAEILGGPCLFQVRIGNQPIKSMGDSADVLVCLNKEALIAMSSTSVMAVCWFMIPVTLLLTLAILSPTRFHSMK